MRRKRRILVKIKQEGLELMSSRGLGYAGGVAELISTLKGSWPISDIAFSLNSPQNVHIQYVLEVGRDLGEIYSSRAALGVGNYLSILAKWQVKRKGSHCHRRRGNNEGRQDGGWRSVESLDKSAQKNNQSLETV